MYRFIRKMAFSRVREKFHTQRASLFMNLMRPKEGVSILDLGGGWGDFLARIQNRVKARFVVAEIGEHYAPLVQKYGFEFIQLEEDQPLPFKDNEFDIVISISVIEHVTLRKEECMSYIPEAQWLSRSWQSQNHFSREIRRVGKSYFVQTPHKRFPIETHTWLPFANLLNHNQMVSLVQFTDKYWVKKCGYADWRLLGPIEMRNLFPDANIYIERAYGLPKSVIAYYLDH